MKNCGKKKMMIVMSAMLIVSILAGTASARSGGPDFFGYTFKDSTETGGPTYNWTEISGTGTMILPNSDDMFIDGIPVGFFFNFYGTDYSQVSITNNGIVLASGGTSQWTNQPIGSSTPHNFISPFWDDIVTWGSAGAVYYQTIGTAPNRKFVVEWYDNQHYSSSPSGVTFEAILQEGTNDMLFQYKDVDFGQANNNNGGSATVGIEGPTGQGLQYSYNEAVLFGDSSPGLAILFNFPAFSGTNMYLSKNAPPGMDHGNTMTYTLYYNNFGGDPASNVVLEDTLPPDVEYITSEFGTYDTVTRKVSWNLGTVGAFPSGGGSRTITVRIPDNVPVGTVIQNTASISTSTLETRYDDNTASAQTTVTGSGLPPNVGVGPVNSGGSTPSVYWGTPITFSYQSCPTATGVDINIHIDDGGPDITGPMTGGPPAWTYTTTFFPRHGTATVTYTVYGCAQPPVSFNIYIDPAGYIYDVTTGLRIAGASVWLQRPDGGGGWENVPTGLSPAIAQPDVNPLITGPDGQYQWDVLAGSYRVHVEAPGYFPADSVVVSIPPPVTDLHVGLTPLPLPPPIPAPATLIVSPLSQDINVGNTGIYTLTLNTPFVGTVTLSWDTGSPDVLARIGAAPPAQAGSFSFTNTGGSTTHTLAVTPVSGVTTGMEYDIDISHSQGGSATVRARATAGVVPIPELSTVVLMSAGMVGLFGLARMQRKDQK